MYKRYKDKVEFVCIYVREAHPTDGWRMITNDVAGVAIKQPAAQEERDAVAKQCCTKLKMTMPLVVDTMDDHVGHLYSGMPDRLYLIDKEGKVVYKSGRGPFGFKPGELEHSVVMLLLDTPESNGRSAGRVPLLDDSATWKQLPAAPRLPAWAKALTATLPRTTAAMLELDYVQRVKSPLDPKLRALMRWRVASANYCGYGVAYAIADLRRLGFDDEAVVLLTAGETNLSEEEKRALDFATKMTVAADTVTDQEVAQLIKDYGESRVVAMVLLIAYGNFQDRLVLSLGLQVEPGGPLPPIQVQVTADKNADISRRERGARGENSSALSARNSSEWQALDFESLQKAMNAQRNRQSRITVPAWEEVRKNLPQGYPANRPVKIRWSLVCMGYQPELAGAWMRCMRTFGEEAKQDRVFEESLFWIITRSTNCFY